jgi:hypothetical protein
MDSDETGHPPNFPTIPVISRSLTSSSSSQVEAYSSVLSLDQESHAHRLAMQEQFISNKGTESAYRLHLRNYETWWSKDQIKRADKSKAEGLVWDVVNAHPITSTKVSIFLNHETKREKV